MKKTNVFMQSDFLAAMIGIFVVIASLIYFSVSRVGLIFHRNIIIFLLLVLGGALVSILVFRGFMDIRNINLHLDYLEYVRRKK